MEKDIYTADFSRLETARVILRCGLTPTDFMHIRGDFTAFSAEASRHAASFFVRSSEAESIESLAQKAYDLVTERLYKNIVRILLITECAPLSKAPFDGQMNDLIDHAWKLACKGRRSSCFLPGVFETHAKLVGVGAPTHIFLPRVAKMLRTKTVLPPHAGVANAVGAITGQVTSVTEINLTPVAGDDFGRVLVVTPDSRRTFSSRARALAFARKEGRCIAEARARAQGARGEIGIREELLRKESAMGYGTIWLGDVLRFTASGSTLR